ncbi:hypothetical protein CLAFUW4_14256 [Fulvia fulva]|uniref:Uncharacterized protein n=1 Tax=Passalora fulva TaxID=5499 RepID=A0A9Q8PMF1_PASFU|nr:uncharacterized protein CLAFUR5_14089 [Fulvia fulva]UJO25115.1 hypothetical protein CLAFUR5_14089 [Fulvia fulva]WPV22697.1 hypothetical protein CLAFUW4_14256 [Fulvia fulva]
MAAQIKTILILGATSGISEAFAQRLHGLGKKVIITGRRQNKIEEIKQKLPGVEGYVMDNTKINEIPSHVEKLFSQYPDIDTVWINGGIQRHGNITKLQANADQEALDEISVNLTGPIILAQHIIPRLLKKGTEANFMVTSSGIAFVPIPLCPIYGATKAGMYHYLVGLRQQLQGTKVNILELVPPYVATDLVFHDSHPALAALTPMPLEEYTRQSLELLEKSNASELKELTVEAAGKAAGSAPRVAVWRNGPGKISEAMPFGG